MTFAAISHIRSHFTFLLSLTFGLRELSAYFGSLLSSILQISFFLVVYVNFAE